MGLFSQFTIWSGGQTGVDQGALDAAIALGIPHGGWCPKGRRSEAGPIPLKYMDVHKKLSFWDKNNMKTLAGDLMKEDPKIMEAYN